MYPKRDAIIITLAQALCLVLSISLAYADKARTDKAPSDKAPSKSKVSATLVDLEITGGCLCPGYSGGPAIQVHVHNKGPHPAAYAKVCVKPGKNGLEQCRTLGRHRPLRAGKRSGIVFLVEGSSTISTWVTAGPKNFETNTDNNSCRVQLRSPKPGAAPDIQCLLCSEKFACSHWQR